MSRKIRWLILVMVLVSLVGCAQTRLEIPDPLDLEAQLETLGVLPYLSPSPPDPSATFPSEETQFPVPECPGPYRDLKFSRPRYNLSVYLGIRQHAAHVEELIYYPNQTGETLSEILLLVEPNWHPGTFSLTNIQVGEAEVENYYLTGGELWVPLATPLPENCLVELVITYHLDFPEQAGVFGYLDDQLVMTNWYPFVPPYQADGGWVVRPPGAFGEHLVYDSADFYVSLEIADAAENVFVAAPAAAEEVDGKLNYYLEGARTFSLAVLTDYSIRVQNFQGIEIVVYSQKATIREVEAAMSAAVTALQVFERLFGPYPFQSLTIAQLDMYDGMEYDGLFFLSEDVFKTYNWGSRNMLVYLVAHETAHNWWFSQVGNDQALEPWLDEALATYSELLYYEIAFPEVVDWWGEFRIDEYDPVGAVNTTIYTHLVYEDYRRAVYLNGARFLDALREQVGDEVFFSFLRSYLEEGRYRLMSSVDFFDLLESTFGVDVSVLKNKYFPD